MKINIKDIFEKEGSPGAHTNSRLDVDEVFAEALSADEKEADTAQAAVESEASGSDPTTETDAASHTEAEEPAVASEIHSPKDDGSTQESVSESESSQEPEQNADSSQDQQEREPASEAPQTSESENDLQPEQSIEEETEPEISDENESAETESLGSEAEKIDATEKGPEPSQETLGIIGEQAADESEHETVAAAAEPDKANAVEPESNATRSEAEDEVSEDVQVKNHETKRFAFSKEYGWPAGITAAFIAIIMLVIVYTTMIPREVNATINGEEFEFSSKSHTVEGFLEEEDIAFCEDDYISMPLETFIYDGIEIEINHATDFTVTADGKTKKYKSLANTVEGALKDIDVKVGEKDIVEPGMDSLLAKNMNIVIKRVEIKEEVVEEEVPFKTVTKDDSSIDEGTTKVVTEGVKGKDKVTYEITYIDGKESSRKEVARETVTAAVDKVVANGTRISFNGRSYSRKLVVKAYAYTGGGRTAMGTRARVGEIAVDPSVIPLGSNVYIEGVGARRAEDTGGNIKGNTIDIYMDTQSQCINWGARYVTIYIQ